MGDGGGWGALKRNELITNGWIIKEMHLVHLPLRIGTSYLSAVKGLILIE